jgi:uncharacterized protein YjbI with pentapeptide repeats
MKKLTLPFLLFLLTISVLDVFAQYDCDNQEQEMNYIRIYQTDFHDSLFKLPPDFYAVEFDSITSFTNSIFNDYVEFNESRFNFPSYFSFCNFQKADFTCVRFLSEANFFECNFNSSVDFLLATFESVADFSYSTFDSASTASFVDTKFNHPVNFSNVKFQNKVDFSEAQFNSKTNFTDVTFDSIAVFYKADFRGETDFSKAVLPNRLNFSYANHISEEIDLTNAIINEKYGLCNINLVGAAISNIRFRYNRFKLWFPDEESVDFELKSNVYEDLLKKQKDEGFTQSYEKLDREYREFKYTGKEGNSLELFWGRLQNWVDKNWWGYGYNKELIILNSLIIYLLFSIINIFILKHLTIRVYEAEKINEYWNETKGSEITLFIKSIPFSLFYTAQIFFGFKFDVDKLKYKENLQGFKIFNLIYFLMVYLSGLVCFAYLANYVLTV